MREIEQKILDFVSRFCFEEQRSPTLAEIAEGIGYTSRGSVHRYVKSLIDEGFLASDGGNKNLHCTGKPQADLTLPLVGRIAAGRPIEAIADSIFLPLVSGSGRGTGLGLSVAQELVHRHGGLIEFRSEPGDTSFTVVLPYGPSGDAGDQVDD